MQEAVPGRGSLPDDGPDVRWAMPHTIAQIEAAIAALQAQSAILGEAVVQTALGPLQAQLAALLTADEGPVAPQSSARG